MKSIEERSEFELETAYFDGDAEAAKRKDAHIPQQADEVRLMAEFQKLIDFPPAPKLDASGKLDPEKNDDEAALRGQELFFGKARCATCHTPPHYTDNQVHDLKVEQFYRPGITTSQAAPTNGPIKTPPAGHQGFATLSTRRSLVDAGRHSGVLQSGARAKTHQGREKGFACLFSDALTLRLEKAAP